MNFVRIGITYIITTSMIGDELPSTSFERGEVTTESRNLTRIEFVRFVNVVYIECTEIEVLVLEDDKCHPVL